MRILMIGAGAVGGFVGGHLTQAGRDVDFLVRPRRAAELTGRGLRIVSDAETEVIEVRTVTASTLADTYDLVLICVKAQALPTAIEDFKAAVGPETAVVPFLNGICHFDRLSRTFGRSAILGGVLKVVTQLDPDGAIRQFLPGGSIEIGELDGAGSTRVSAIAETLATPGFIVTVPESIMDAVWAKWVFIATLGAITSLTHGPIGDAMATDGAVAFAESVLAEAASVAHSAGHSLVPEQYAAIRTMVTTEGATTTSSLSRDLLTNRPTEVESVLGDLINRARAADLILPRIEAAAFTLRAHNARLTRKLTSV